MKDLLGLQLVMRVYRWVFYNFGICNGEIIRSASPIIMRGETNENNASNATTMPAAGMGSPMK